MQKIYAQKWKQKFAGGFLKGAFWRAIHDANLAVALICTWRVDTTPAIWFFTMETNTFWSCFQYLLDFWRILMQKLRVIFQIVRALIIFWSEDSSLINSPESSQLQSHPCLVKPYAFLQISHTWFDWNLVNDCSLCEENCMDKLKAAKNCIACVQHTLLPKKIEKSLIEASWVKFIFSKKAKKIDKIFIDDLTPYSKSLH